VLLCNVDAVLGQQQAVIKGLSDYVGNVRGVSGLHHPGDGAVSLILDIGSLWDMPEQWKERCEVQERQKAQRRKGTEGNN